MRFFVLISVLATAVYADVSHLTGYTYQKGCCGYADGSGGHGLSSFGSGSTGFSSGGLAKFGSANLGGPIGGSSSGFSSGLLGGGSGFSLGPGFTSGNVGHSHHHQQHHVEQSPAEVEFVKEFYTFDAPEEDYHENESIQRTKESLKKNLQVIFIKAPEVSGVEHAALSLAKSASESKTAIYILQKQPDISEFSNQLNLIHTHNAHKPDVHFVKYKTAADAAAAQQTIQSQYESLGGLSVHKHGGVPETLNYASHYAPAFGSHQIIDGGQQAVSGGHHTYHTGAVLAPSIGGASAGQQTYHADTILAPSSGAHHTHHESSSSTGFTGSAPTQNYLPAKA